MIESFKEQEKNCIVVDGDQGLCLGAGPLAGQGQCHLMLLMKESFNGVPGTFCMDYFSFSQQSLDLFPGMNFFFSIINYYSCTACIGKAYKLSLYLPGIALTKYVYLIYVPTFL